MSLRSDYELTIASDKPLDEVRVREFCNTIPWPVHCVVSDSAVDGSAYARLSVDRKRLYLVVQEIHPEEMENHIARLSQVHPQALFDVEEYIHAKTEMVEPGRFPYLLRNGAQVKKPRPVRKPKKACTHRYRLFWVYGDADDPPYLVVDPPHNFKALLKQWNKLDKEYCKDQSNKDWLPVNDWLKKKGVKLISPPVVYLDDCR